MNNLRFGSINGDTCGYEVEMVFIEGAGNGCCELVFGGGLKKNLAVTKKVCKFAAD